MTLKGCRCPSCVVIYAQDERVEDLTQENERLQARVAELEAAEKQWLVQAESLSNGLREVAELLSVLTR